MTAAEKLHQLIQILPEEQINVETALSLGLKEFEDSIQLACATLNQLDAIVTRNQKDFSGSNFPIYSPRELLNQISQKNI